MTQPNNQVRSLLQMIANREGQVISRQLAANCRQLIGVEVTAPEIEMIKNSLLILFLEDLGGEVTYTIDKIDDDPEGKILTLEQTKYHGKPALKFKVRNR